MLKKALSCQLRRWQDFISCFNENDAIELIYWHSATIISSDRIEWTRRKRSSFIILHKHILLAVIGMYRLFPEIRKAVDSNKQLGQLDESLEIHKNNITFLYDLKGKKGLEAFFNDAKRQLYDMFWQQDEYDVEFNEERKNRRDMEDNNIQLNIPPGGLDGGEVLFATKQVFALLKDIIDFQQVLFKKEPQRTTTK